jgi:hypothetical protein
MQLTPLHGFTVSLVDFEAPPPDAVMSTDAEEATGLVVTVKLAELAPGGTVTSAETGTAATKGFEPFSVTTKPAAGATPVSVTVPVEGLPPCTVDALRLSAATAGAFIVRCELFVAPW